jgi:mono/diheme cytochrome c family protein
MTQADRVARGEYLVKVIGCGDCHTPGALAGAPDMSRHMSGTEYGWVGPWGTTYARNVTPDSTGLAGWTEDEIVRALKAGTRKDGTPVRPPMPWPWFSNLTDEDAHAIAAYLLSLPPVHHAVPAALPPGVKAKGPVIAFPAPSAWDRPAAAPGGTGQ